MAPRHDNQKQRRPEWRRNEKLESLLAELSYWLENTDGREITKAPEDPVVVFVCGNARSGTTLMLQYLAASGVFAYPSNLIARFYMAPQVGELIQQMLFDPVLEHRQQFADLRRHLEPISFTSELGQTPSTLDPNEFWYFWRRFFDFGNGERAEAGISANEKTDQFRREIALWGAAAQKPLAMKAGLAIWRIDALRRLLPKSRFLIMQRRPEDLMISLLNARYRYWGEIDSWYGPSLPEEISVVPKHPYEQIALQAAAIDALVIEPLRSADPARFHVVQYEEFCTLPNAIWGDVLLQEFTPSLPVIDPSHGKAGEALTFEAPLCLPDERAPHHDVTRTELVELYDRFHAQLAA